MAKTHRNFKSIHNKIQNAEDIYDAVGTILIHQTKFQKRYPPWEIDEWNEENIQDFKIDLEKIDRLYHVDCQDSNDGVEYELAARMDFEGRRLYLHVKVYTYLAWDGLVGEGEMYLTFDAQVFLKSIINGNCNPQGIWKSMVDDGHVVEEPSEFDLQRVESWRSVPMLKFLCHMAVYQKEDRLKTCFEALPHPVVRSVEEFLKVRRARDHRDEDIVTYPDYFGVYISSSLSSNHDAIRDDEL